MDGSDDRKFFNDGFNSSGSSTSSDSSVICSKLLNSLNTFMMLRLRTYFHKNKSDSEKTDVVNPKIDECHFVNAINTIFGGVKYNLDALKLFKILDFEDCGFVSWNQLLEYLIDYSEKRTGHHWDKWTPIKKNNIFIKDLDHCKKEPISIIISIETKTSFSYLIISKHGKVGVYDGKLNLLLEYDIFFVRTGVMKRVRDIWVTAAAYLPDMRTVIITASDKSMIIYDVSTLCHAPIFLITGITNIPTCLSYNSSNSEYMKSHLVIGDDLGGLTIVIFKQPKIGMFHKKNPDKMTKYFWIELQNSLNEPFCKVKFKRKIHSRPVKKIVHVSNGNSIVSCSNDCDASIVIQHNKGIMNPYIFKIPRGVSCFHYSESLNLIVTGSADKRLRLWEPFVTEFPSVVFPLQSSKIIDVIILAHFHIIISLNRNGVLKMWNIFDQICVQSINIHFPSFGVLGRPIQFGFESIYYGSARVDPYEVVDREIGEFLDENSIKDDFININIQKNIEYNRWSRSEIIVICYNHIAVIPLNDKSILNNDVNVRSDENDCDIFALLPPPEKNHRPRKPSMWDNNDTEIRNNIKKEEIDLTIAEDNLKESDEYNPNYDDNYKYVLLDDLLQKSGLTCISDKDFLLDSGNKHNINTKYIMQQSKRDAMKTSVAQSAPFTALDLYPHKEIKFSSSLPLSIRMQKKSGLEYFNEPQQILRHGSCFSMESPKSSYTTSTNCKH